MFIRQLVDVHKLSWIILYLYKLFSLWKQLDVQYSDTSRRVVAILFDILHSVEDSWVYQFQLFNAPFVSNQFYSSHDQSIESWNKEFEART